MAAEDFITQLLQLGIGGINLKRTVDVLTPLQLARMRNLARDQEGRLITRPGLLRMAWAGGARVHSLARIQAALAGGEFVRVAGVDGSIHVGREGAFTKLEEGFSGQPFSFAYGHPPLSSDSWLYIGDSAKMVKLRASDHLVLPLGMRAPAAVAIAVAGSDNRVSIDNCEAAGWTNNAGTGGAPSNATNADAAMGAASLRLTTAVGSATAGYYNFWGKALTLDMSTLSGITGNVDASDDDQLHLFMKMQAPAKVEEIRFYFVVSDDFDATVLPGTSTEKNTNSYFKTFIPSQFTSIVEAAQTAEGAILTAVQTRLLEEAIAEAVARSGQAQTAEEQAAESRAISERRLALGRGQWTEFGAPGTPLRRAEFLRIGSNPDYSWATVKGLIIYVKMNTNEAAWVQLDDIYLRGGYKLDSSAPTSVGYDWRYRHYDPRTGARGRMSPVMADADKLDLVRQAARITPEAYGDPEVRQEFFRRGGTLPSNWYFCGINHSDGGCGKDNFTDGQVLAAGTKSDSDYHAPVSTVDRDGKAVYGQPIPVIFGPLSGILFGLGDPYRPGHIYWTLPDEFDHWPVYANAEVCSPDEELMNGGVFGGSAFVFSRRAFYPLYISIADVTVRPASSTCAKGLAARQGLAVGLDGIYFVATDGIWKTTGGGPVSLTEESLEPLFRGETKNGYPPIDWLASAEIRLGIHNNELWFTFQDVLGGQQTWIFSLVFQFWRHYSLAWPVSGFLSEDYGQPKLLLGSSTTGRIFEHAGTSDDGVAIPCNLRTGALNQGMPRQLKVYGDIELELDLRGHQALLLVLYNREGQQLAPLTINPLVGQKVYILDPFGGTPLQSYDISLDLSWTAFGDSPLVGRGGPSFVPQPESSVGRVTEWDALGGGANKRVKGILIEADTFGQPKAFNVLKDGGTVAATSFTIQTTGRQFKHIIFDSIVDARVVRLQPTDTNAWLPYQLRWVFDLEPLELTTWETQLTDHGVHAVQVLGESWITTRSTANVTLTVTAYNDAGGVVATGAVVIPSTAGNKQKQYVKLPMLKGVLFRYRFTSTVAFRLFREESVVEVNPWGADEPVRVQPFGTDDLDVQRIVGDAEGAGLKGQRWLDTSATAGQT